MPTVTWARVDPARRAAVVEAAEAEFGAHGFSGGSLNVIARRAGVAKGSLFQYFADHPHERALHAAATLEVDTDARVSVRSVIHRHYLEVLRPLVHDAQGRGDFRKDADTEALMSLLLLIFPHLALAPYMRGLDPILGLDEPSPEQPALAVRRLVAVLAAAFAANSSLNSAPQRSEEFT